MASWTRQATLSHHASVWASSDGKNNIYYLGKSAGLDEPNIVQKYDTSTGISTLIGDPTDPNEFDNPVDPGNIITRLGGQGDVDGSGIVQWKGNVYLPVYIEFPIGTLD